MEINRNNYEAYFIDYLEGTLDENVVDNFLEFIKLNPDLKEELTLFESVSAVPENISFKKKNGLYKEKYDSEKEFEKAAIANLEGDSLKNEKSEFATYLNKHPEKKKEAALFDKTKLEADESILFPNKKKLYRKPLGTVFLLWSGRIAAVLILAFAIFVLNDKIQNNILPENQFTKIEKNIENKEPITISEDKTKTLDEKKKEPRKVTIDNQKPNVNKATPEKKTNKSIRETTKGRLEQDDIAAIRLPLEIPAKITAITASLDLQIPKARMETMFLVYPDKYYGDEMLLADKVRGKFNLGKITKAGLNLVNSISNEKFTYQTNNAGKVTEYNYDSRLLAFSIPSKRTK